MNIGSLEGAEARLVLAREGFHICSTVVYLHVLQPRMGLHNGYANVFASR